jgi:hypothetical protein
MRIDSVQAPSKITSLNVRTPSGSVAHIFPTIQIHAQRDAATPAADTGPLLYHGGEIVQEPHLYQIFWKPKPKLLQNGGATKYSANYVNVNVALAAYYNGHGIGDVTTQYYQHVNGVVIGISIIYRVDQEPVVLGVGANRTHSCRSGSGAGTALHAPFRTFGPAHEIETPATPGLLRLLRL